MAGNSTASDNNKYITPRNRARDFFPITIKTVQADEQTKYTLLKNFLYEKREGWLSLLDAQQEAVAPKEMIEEVVEESLPVEENIFIKDEIVTVERAKIPGIKVVEISQDVKERVLKNIKDRTPSRFPQETKHHNAAVILEATKQTIFKEITPHFIAIRDMIAEYDNSTRNSEIQSRWKKNILENIVYMQSRLGNLLCDHFLKKDIVVPLQVVRKFFIEARGKYIPINFHAISGITNTPEASFLGAVSYASVLYNAERVRRLNVHRLVTVQDLNFFDFHHSTDIVIFDKPKEQASKRDPLGVYLVDVKTGSDSYIRRLKPNANNAACSYNLVKKRIRAIAEQKGIDSETPLMLFKLTVPTGVKMNHFSEGNVHHTMDWFMDNIKFRLREMYIDVQNIIHWPPYPKSPSPESSQSE